MENKNTEQPTLKLGTWKGSLKRMAVYIGSVSLIVLIGSFMAVVAYNYTARDPEGLTPHQRAELQRIKDQINEHEIDIYERSILNEKDQQMIEQLNQEKEEIKSSVLVLPEAKAETVEAPERSDTSLEKLAYAVAMAETGDCTIEGSYGVMYNNCFGIKRGSIVPCETGQNSMCIFSSKTESYEAFKKIWVKGYGGGFPTYQMAATWTGNDRPDNWLSNVKFYYEQ